VTERMGIVSMSTTAVQTTLSHAAPATPRARACLLGATLLLICATLYSLHFWAGIIATGIAVMLVLFCLYAIYAVPFEAEDAAWHAKFGGDADRDL
jgi:protein-S-isoprenylcysteine O-methyltransferase Ste14